MTPSPRSSLSLAKIPSPSKTPRLKEVVGILSRRSSAPRRASIPFSNSSRPASLSFRIPHSSSNRSTRIHRERARGALRYSPRLLQRYAPTWSTTIIIPLGNNNCRRPPVVAPRNAGQEGRQVGCRNSVFRGKGLAAKEHDHPQQGNAGRLATCQGVNDTKNRPLFFNKDKCVQTIV